MPLERFHTSGLAINSYLLYDEKSKKCAVIDPVRAVEPYIKYAADKNLEITDIVETHVHADFVELFPAHGAGSLCGKEIGSNPWSTLGYERHSNPGFTFTDEKQWLDKMQKNLPAAPQYFKTLKKINVEGPSCYPAIHPKRSII